MRQQRVTRATRRPALSAAVIAPLVVASAVGAASPRFPGATGALRSAPVTQVAAVTAPGNVPSGPAVVAVQRPRPACTSLRPPSRLRRRFWW